MTAELGKAKHLPIDKLEAGMKVHRDVMGRKDRVLVNSGEILSRKHIDQLKKWENRSKPMGQALPKKDVKNRYERVEHADFQGGWRPSHFNPHGILVSSTLASGADVPAVEADPTKSKVFQQVMTQAKPSITVPRETIFTVIEEEIKTLESVNAQLSGTVHSVKPEMEIMGQFEERRDMLKSENDELIQGLKSGGNNDVQPPAPPKRRGRKPKS